MGKFLKTVAVAAVATFIGVALYVYSTDKDVIVLTDGTIQTADETWESENSIFYEIDNETYELHKDEVKTYGKRNFKLFFLEIKTVVKNIKFPIDYGLVYLTVLVALLLFILIGLRVSRANKPTPKAADKQKINALAQESKDENPNGAAPISSAQKSRALEQESKDEILNEGDIVRFFLNLFKGQIGAKPGAPVEFVPLKSQTSSPNHIYELRVKHMTDWAKRRMTIGPLGEESGSKSKCYYVIYDKHMVVKIPATPVTDFEVYIESLKKEMHIVNKLVPKECIIPRVSGILGLIHTLPNSDRAAPEKLEENYIDWLRMSPEYQEYLKINNSFVYVMDLSKYYFLGHILDELHDIKDSIAREITENAQLIFEPGKFIGRYGAEHDAIFEIRLVYNRCEVDVRRLLDQAGITASVPAYQVQSWFFTHLAAKEVPPNGSGYPERFIFELNRLLKKTMQDNSKAIDEYRNTIKDYIHMSMFEQNKAHMTAIMINLLDLLAWFRKKRVSMRDLKPDNLFVAGDNARYPLFLRSAKEFSLGIIDVETAVDFETQEQTEIKQPLLGGTPFFATPSHFIRNDVLIHKFKNLGNILHLQDWYATLGMIYKVVTGEHLFDQTAKLFGDLRQMMIMANKPQTNQSDIFEEASRIFWHSAVAEFQLKIGKSEKALKSIVIAVPETVKYMFASVLANERKSIGEAIRRCVDSPNIFKKAQIRERLLKFSSTKICQFKADLVSKAKASKNPTSPRTEAITILHKLAVLKAQSEHHAYMLTLLSQAEPKVCAYDIMTFMFNVVLNNMYRTEWKPLFDEAARVSDVPDEAAAGQATI